MISRTYFQVLMAATVLLVGTAHAQIPEPLNYQGYLADSAGQALDDATTITFSLYAVENGGSPLWSDTQLVVPDQGLFNAELGTLANPFPTGLFNTPLWLGVTISSDDEMTPRRALRSAAYAKKAGDAQSLEGRSANDLDQADALSALSGVVTANNGNIGSLSGSVSALTMDVTNLEQQVDALDNSVGDNSITIDQIDAVLSNLSTDVNLVENTILTLQSRVTGSCAAGSSIRSIGANGSVTCEIDDAGPWLTNVTGQPYLASGGRIGIGTTAPAAAIQIDAPEGTDPFRARIASATKLRVHQNGSVSVGTSSAGPENGLYVGGAMGVGTSTPSARGTIADPNWQFSLFNNDVGGSAWFIGSSADSWAAGGGKLIFAPNNNSNDSAMTLNGSGNVGIDNNDPLGRLHVSGGSDVNATSGGYAIFGSNGGTQIAIDNNEIMARGASGASALALNAEGGTVTINSGGSVSDGTSLEVTGEVVIDSAANSSLIIGKLSTSPSNMLVSSSQFEEGFLGSSSRPFWRTYSREFYASSPVEYRTYSDRSLKRNVMGIENALDTVMQLDGVQYELMKHPFEPSDRVRSDKDEFDRANQLGFIAQDLEKVLPQLVKEDETSGLKTVGYMGVVPILVEAIKEQQRLIERQDARIAELELRLK